MDEKSKNILNFDAIATAETLLGKWSHLLVP